jgi:hypothetical protein
VIAILIAGNTIEAEEGGNDFFAADKVWLYITILTVGYLLSRGLAKAGSRDPYWDRPDTGPATAQAWATRSRPQPTSCATAPTATTTALAAKTLIHQAAGQARRRVLSRLFGVAALAPGQPLSPMYASARRFGARASQASTTTSSRSPTAISSSRTRMIG